MEVLSLRRLNRIGVFYALILCASSEALQTAPKLTSIAVRDSAEGVTISASSGALPEARVLRLSNPDRLVLDFAHITLSMSTAERQRWSARGVRMAFHEEDQSTRVVFDIPAGQQSWMQREGDALVVSFTPQATTGAPARVSAPSQPPTRTANVAATSQQPRASTVGHVVIAVPQSQPVPVPETHLRVTSQDGLLQVSAKGVPFKAILDEVASATGASVQMMTPVEGSKSEVFEYGPAPPMEVIRKLFEGSQYNYLLVSEPNSTTRISRIVVTSALRYSMGNDGLVSDDDTNPENLSGIAPLPKQEPPTPDRKPN